MNLVVLGPQRPQPNLKQAVADVTGPIVAITAGWRHSESEVEPIEAELGRTVTPIPAYQWFDGLQRQQPALAAEYKEQQSRILAYNELYRIRLHAAMHAMHRLLEREQHPDLVGIEVERAVAAVREIDDEMLASHDAIRANFPRVQQPWKLPAVMARHRQAKELIESAGAVLVAGGHVAILLNRMHFYGLDKLITRKLAAGGRVVCWSAGAMVMTERVVLFYDDPPEGPSEPEVLDRGLGLIEGAVIFPHAGRRLRLDRTDRLRRLARRFSPSTCIGMENGAHLGPNLTNQGTNGAAFRVLTDGSQQPLEQP